MKKRFPFQRILKSATAILTPLVPVVVVFSAAIPAEPVAAAKSISCSDVTVSSKWPTEKWPEEKWPENVQTEPSDTCRIRIILTPEDSGGCSLTADLVLVYEPRESQPSSVTIVTDGASYPVLKQDSIEEGLVDMKGKKFHYRRLRAYEK